VACFARTCTGVRQVLGAGVTSGRRWRWSALEGAQYADRPRARAGTGARRARWSDINRRLTRLPSSRVLYFSTGRRRSAVSRFGMANREHPRHSRRATDTIRSRLRSSQATDIGRPVTIGCFPGAPRWHRFDRARARLRTRGGGGAPAGECGTLIKRCASDNHLPGTASGGNLRAHAAHRPITGIHDERIMRAEDGTWSTWSTVWPHRRQDRGRLRLRRCGGRSATSATAPEGRLDPGEEA